MLTGTIVSSQKEPGIKGNKEVLHIPFAQSVGAVVYTDCFSSEE